MLYTQDNALDDDFVQRVQGCPPEHLTRDRLQLSQEWQYFCVAPPSTLPFSAEMCFWLALASHCRVYPLGIWLELTIALWRYRMSV